MRDTKGITLIALVITIIILLILAAVSIATLTGENGILSKAKIAKIRTEYTSAKEIIELKLMEIQAECSYQQKAYTIKEINEKIEDEKIKKDKEYYENDALKGILVSVKEYSKYKFLIGENGRIIGATITTIPNTMESIKPIEQFEKEILEGKDFIDESSTPLDNNYEIGQYVKYNVGGYSTWIIAGKSENGEVMLVSEGGTELYTIDGETAEEFYLRLDQYCDEKYVDKNYATVSENYSYVNNIGKNNITNIKVLYGTKEATSEELLTQEPNGWFLNSYATSFQYGVYELGVNGNHSYPSIGQKVFIRPIVYLRYGIEYKRGDGTKENPYELVANSGYDMSPIIKLKTGDYVQYSANNYSRWITVGTDEEGVTTIVSAGATDYYNFVGSDWTDAYKKLDDYCNERYVDDNLATSAESYSYTRNISPYATNNKTVLWGTTSETSNELMTTYPYAWFISNYETTTVYKLNTGEYSIGGLNYSYFIRPVVKLKKGIVITGGRGTKDLPYIIEIK